MSLAHLGFGLLHSPHVIGRFVYNYGWSWFAPTISLSRPVQKEIELQETLDKRHIHDPASGGSENIIPASGGSKNDNSTALIPYVPITIKMPTAYDVSAKIITTVVVEVPVLVLKNLYNSPVPTAVALYALLPTEVWMIVGPRILYYLPKLL